LEIKWGISLESDAIPNMGHNNTMTSLSSQLPQVSVVTTTAMESILNATIAAATPANIDIGPNNLSNNTPFNYSMKCSSHVINVTPPDVFEKGPIFDEELFIDRIRSSTRSPATSTMADQSTARH
jgi:hypothetical protein